MTRKWLTMVILLSPKDQVVDGLFGGITGGDPNHLQVVG